MVGVFAILDTTLEHIINVSYAINRVDNALVLV